MRILLYIRGGGSRQSYKPPFLVPKVAIIVHYFTMH